MALVAPDAGFRLIQSAVVAAFHGAQEPSFGLTDTVTPRSLASHGTLHVSTPASGAFAANVYVQAIPATVAVNGCPAIVAVRLCGVVPPFAAAATVTDPLPDPEVGDTVNPAVVVAVQFAGAHPDGVALTFTTWEPPVGAKLAVAGAIANEHAAGGVDVGWVVLDGALPLHDSSGARRAPAANDRMTGRRMAGDSTRSGRSRRTVGNGLSWI